MIKRLIEININAPKAILKITSGAMSAEELKYFTRRLIPVSILVSDNHSKTGRHICF